MAIIKCKMCGGDIELSADKTIGTCDSCGSTMTLPKIDDEQRAAAFNRGNHFRRIGEFDKALTVYERIVEEDETDAEAHWCCALCRFGIEYVEDPATGEWLPTCHRASFDSFLEDVDYLAAVQYADAVARARYQHDAGKINEVQRGILATSQHEKPFDVFICYKETDESGARTRDSMLAQEIYYSLTEQGRRVFFARITLEDKVGTQYEPYIFAALNSAKVMVVVGTSAKNLNAVWVKNEWSRFLALMKKDRTKLLLPCYRDMDPYDMPEQLSVLQSYDMSRIGFLQDLVRGVGKVLGEKSTPREPETVVVHGETAQNNAALLQRGDMALEDGDWQAADEFFDRVLDMEAKCAEAYCGKFLASVQSRDFPTFAQRQKEAARNSITPEERFPKVDEAHIKEIARRYAIPEGGLTEGAIRGMYVAPEWYLTEEMIRRMYDAPERYATEAPGWREAASKIRASYVENRDLVRARSFATGNFRQRIEGEIADLENWCAKQIEQAEAREAQAREAAEAAYAQSLEKTDQRVEKAYKDACQQWDSDYQAACQLEANANSSDECKRIATMFEKLGNRGDAAERAKKLRDRAVKEAEREERVLQRRATVTSCLVVLAIIVGYFITSRLS